MDRRRFLITIGYSAVGVLLSPVIIRNNISGMESKVETYFDFSRCFSELSLIEEAAVIDFGSEKDREFLLDGWSGTEDGHTWAMGEAASVKFYAINPRSDKKIEITCNTFELLKYQKMKIYLNSRFIKEIFVSRIPEKFSVNLPAKYLEQNENILRFVFERCARPIDYDINRDSRCLAIDFKKIVLGNTRNATSSPETRVRLDADNWISIPNNSGIHKFLFVEPNSVLKFCASAPDPSPNDNLSIVVKSENKTSRVFCSSSKSLPGEKVIDLHEYSGKFLDFNVEYEGEPLNPGKKTIKWKGALQKNGGLPDKRPNLLFVVVDTLRADHCACLGASIKTPNIDNLAKRGALFSQAYSHIPITLPSHAAMFSSEYPHVMGVLNNGQHVLDSYRLFAEFMGGIRFFNAGVVSLGTINPSTNIDQGFHEYRGTSPFSIRQGEETNEELRSLISDIAKRGSWSVFLHYADPHEPYHGHGLRNQRVQIQLNGKTIDEIDISEKSTFSFVCKMRPGKNELRFKSSRKFSLREFSTDPGVPWRGESRDNGGRHIIHKAKEGKIVLKNSSRTEQKVRLRMFISEHLNLGEIRESYKKEVEYVDQKLGQALELFNSNGLLENTLIVFTSDHGEGLGDHKHIGHISQLYNSLIHVPLILVHPETIKPGSKIDTRVRHVDVLPTILDIFKVRPISGMRGESLMPIVCGQDTSNRPVMSMTFKDESPRNLVSLIHGNYKIIKDMNTNNVELYNIAKDPAELENIAENSSGKLNEMDKLLDEYLVDCDYPLKDSGEVKAKKSVDPDTIKMLRGLGYVK